MTSHSQYKKPMIKGVAALLLPLILMLTFAACSGDNKDKNDPKKEVSQKVTDLFINGLHGKVKSFTEKVYSDAVGVMADDPVYISKNSYLPNGYLKEIASLDMENIVRTFIHRYAKDSIIITNILSRNDTILDKKDFIYLLDKKGVRYKMLSLDNSGNLMYNADIKNNEAGFPVEYKHNVPKEEERNKLPCKDEKTYDERNFMISEQMYRYVPSTKTCEPTGTIRHFVNDERGNCVEEKIIKNGNMLLAKYSYKYQYDAIGNWTEKTRFAHTSDSLEKVTMVLLRQYEMY